MLPRQKNFHLLSIIFFSLILFFFSVSLANPETTALLAFKAASDPFNSLSSWVASSGPCSGSWLGVTCDPETSRVAKLVLEDLNLTGSTQPLSQLGDLRLLSLNHNLLSSSLNLSSWPHLKHLYLSHNRFFGTIPADISRLRHLRRLDLSYNQFSGEIPFTELTQLRHLLTIRLESNSFTGTLSSAKNSDSGSISDLNVSNNNLSGQIPTWLSRFGAASFLGNELLCGNPLPYECSDQTVRNPPVQSRVSGRSKGVSNNAALLAVSIVGIAVALLVIVVSATCCWRTKRNDSGTHHNKIANGCGYVSKHYGPGELKKKKSESAAKWAQHGPGGGPRDSEDMVVLEGCKEGVGKAGDLLKASAEMLGKGSVGTTFKVVMDGGDAVVVVKRVRERRNGGKEIDGFLRQIGGLRHPNITSLRAYHNSSFELLLVYDFMPNGSLHFVLHGNRGPGRTPLGWATRLKLAAGSAQGLAFLHGCNKAKLFHGHLTSSNILVDHVGNARIADIGLQQLLPVPFSSNSAYKAPELMLPGNKSPRKFTQKCDVYSFGVVLLEILTGKMAGEEGEMSLVEWVKMVVQKDCSRWEVLDFELLGDKEMEEEMWALLEVGLLCLTPSPKDRPTMGMVHRMIEDIGEKGVREYGGAKYILDDLTSDSSPSNSESTP